MDASAAIGMAQRQGLNKVRHVEVDVLWIQEQVEEGAISVRKVLGTENPADAMTKYLPASKMDKFMEVMSQSYQGGRADKSLKVQA